MTLPVPTLYLDTSVIGGFFDDEWKDATQVLWQQKEAGRWRFLSSAITFDELAEAPEKVRSLFESTFPADALVPVPDEVEQLAARYIAHAILPVKYSDDARHVAACTVARLDYLVSWNFRHLVNVQREAGFNAVNRLQGYPPVRIVNPLELIYGNED